eukprot:335343-Ditylum_brightwellii.AAC.1
MIKKENEEDEEEQDMTKENEIVEGIDRNDTMGDSAKQAEVGHANTVNNDQGSAISSSDKDLTNSEGAAQKR